MIHGASKVTVIPIVICALGSISKRAKTWYDKLGVPEFIGSVQLSAILGTAHLLSDWTGAIYSIIVCLDQVSFPVLSQIKP